MTQISLQADIEISVPVSGALIDEFNRQESGAMNLRVGIDLPIFPNYYNLIILTDVRGERDPILTQCIGVYDPDTEERAAGAVPHVRLDRNIRELPESLLELLTAADPRVLEGGNSEVTTINDVTGASLV